METRHLIGLRTGCTEADCYRLVRGLGGRVIDEFPPFRVLVADRLDPKAEKVVRAHQGIEHVEKDHVIHVLGADAARQMDIAIPWQKSWELQGKEFYGRTTIPWGVRSVAAPDVWPVTKGESATVAILDTGIDTEHPDLKDRIVGGYSALGPWAGAGYHDKNGHGTHVAGTVAATGVRGGVLGVAPRANLIAVKTLDDRGMGHISFMLRGLSWIARQKKRIPIVNMSLGAPTPSPLLLRAINYLHATGTLVIAASGNSGPQEDSVAYPARFLQTIAVGAYDRQDQVATFSSRGDSVDYIAPGTEIRSTWPGGQYHVLDGTSMAAPHVTGVAALLWAVFRCSRRVEEALRVGTTPVDNTPPSSQGKGRINARLALCRSMGKESRQKKGTLTW